MKADLTDFETGWFGLSIELSAAEIDELVEALLRIKQSRGHFHYRSTFEGAPGIGDIEMSCAGEGKVGPLELDTSQPVAPEDGLVGLGELALSSQELPGVRYRAMCDHCGVFVPFVLFQSSFYDFRTFIGTGSGTRYRLDMELCKYAATNVDQILEKATAHEESTDGALLELPQTVPCPSCGRTFDAATTEPGEAVQVAAVVLQPVAENG